MAAWQQAGYDIFQASGGIGGHSVEIDESWCAAVISFLLPVLNWKRKNGSLNKISKKLKINLQEQKKYVSLQPRLRNEGFETV